MLWKIFGCKLSANVYKPLGTSHKNYIFSNENIAFYKRYHKKKYERKTFSFKHKFSRFSAFSVCIIDSAVYTTLLWLYWSAQMVWGGLEAIERKNTLRLCKKSVLFNFSQTLLQRESFLKVSKNDRVVVLHPFRCWNFFLFYFKRLSLSLSCRFYNNLPYFLVSQVATQLSEF